MKNKMYQQYILKIHSDKILRANKNLKITLKEAREQEELVSLGDSNCLRMIDEITGTDRNEKQIEINSIRSQIKKIKKEKTSIDNKKKIRQLYSQLDKIQFKTEYISVIMNNKGDFDKLNKGFKINGISYKRLVGTASGVKVNTVVYCAVRNKKGINIYSELTKRMDCGRDLDKKIVAGKFEAYKSLTCSASIPVSYPKGILVVDDIVNVINEDVIFLDDSKTEEPIMSYENQKIELTDSDGCGMICPMLSERWSTECDLDYMSAGFCIRNAFCKGMVFTFDFHEFAKRYAKSNVIKDVWNNEHNIEDIEMIIPVSVLKLWDSYNSIEHYINCCKENGYTFSLTKTCPKKLDEERNLNYQFIQSYYLSDNDIDRLIKPTVDEIKDVLSNDINKTILFMGGKSERDLKGLESFSDNVLKALMIDKRMMNDNFVINRLNFLIKKRINEAKSGCVKVKGNYSIVSGDLFAFCQHIFNVKSDKLGLLKAGELYNQYWVNKGAEKVACFRPPMCCHNNIKVADVIHNDDIDYWYRYMNTVTVLNCHDTISLAESGCDRDGDIFLLTDNSTLINNYRNLKTINCIQKKAEKVKISEEQLIKSNKNGFGNNVGVITNRITSMFSVQAQFPADSEEFKILDYRIMCGQCYQQSEIDKIKGIVATVMPKNWYDNKVNKILPDDTEEIIKRKKLYAKIVADKKPYFFIYLYPQLKNKYKKFMDNVNNKCMIEFDCTLEKLINKPYKNEKEREFIEWYYKANPVEIHDCTMNRLCRRIEHEFDGYVSKVKRKEKFDYTIMKSDYAYDKTLYQSIKKIFEEYIENLKLFTIQVNTQRINNEMITAVRTEMINNFKIRCESICSNKYELCNIVLDLCYTSEKNKKFAWDICGDTIIENLLNKNDNCFSYFIENKTGEVVFAGERYSKIKTKIGDEKYENYFE